VLAGIVCLSFLSLAFAAAPPKRFLPIDGSGQKASQLCWAAVAEMAVNAVAGPALPMTQERQAALARSGIEQLPDASMFPPEKAALFASQLAFCTPDNIGNCNSRWHPVLEGVAQDLPPSEQALTPEELMTEIGEIGRPVIFAWRYSERDSTTRPVGMHYLIAIGYDSTNSAGFLQVWDPWPVGAAGLSGGKLSQIRYSTYADPGLDMGLPKEHLLSLPGLRRFASPPVTPNPPPSISVEGGTPSSPPIQGVVEDSAAARAARSARPRFREVSFATAVRNSLPERQRGEILRDRGAGRPDSEALVVGTPFPILALHVSDIVANRNRPARLLKTRTSSVLYPVMLRDQVVDSFLMANVDGKWVETGYANTAITSQLVRWRTLQIGREGAKERDFFLLSVPQYSAFFTSFKPGRQVLAVAASTDSLIKTREGESQPAIDVLKNIADAELMQRASSP
jgi:hypothetical protein